MQNGEIVFDDTAGLVGTVGANNNDQSQQYQFVYNETVSLNVTKCPTMTATSSTGELLWSVFEFICVVVYNMMESFTICEVRDLFACFVETWKNEWFNVQSWVAKFFAKALGQMVAGQIVADKTLHGQTVARRNRCGQNVAISSGE
jgi:hypothetical protein